MFRVQYKSIRIKSSIVKSYTIVGLEIVLFGSHCSVIEECQCQMILLPWSDIRYLRTAYDFFFIIWITQCIEFENKASNGHTDPCLQTAAGMLDQPRFLGCNDCYGALPGCNTSGNPTQKASANHQLPVPIPCICGLINIILYAHSRFCPLFFFEIMGIGKML